MDEENFSFGLSDLEFMVEQLNQISPPPPVDVAVANVGEPSSSTANNYFQPLEDALLLLNQNPSSSDVENYFHPLELAMHQIDQTPASSSPSSLSPSPSPSSCSHANESQVPPPSPPPTPPTPPIQSASFPTPNLEEVHVQHGGQSDSPPRPSTSSSSNIETVSRDRFNNLELRRVFTVPPARNIPDLAQFYDDVMLILREMAGTVRAQVGRNDVIQLELIGENVQNHVSVVVEDEHGDAILPAFEGLLERLVQSNAEIASDARLELVVQVVHDPRGGVKRKLDKTLDCEIIRIKRQHLYIVDNRNDHLCFAINLAHVNDPLITDNQALEQGREFQRLVGLSYQTPVTFTDVCKFEKILNRKIVIFYRSPDQQPLSQFETAFSDRSNPLFLFLFQNHYYGIKNLKAFLGVPYVCHYCYKSYMKPYAHQCKGHCSVCNNPDCTKQELKPVACSDCNRTCRTPLCFDRHKEPRERPLGETHSSICNTIKRCQSCKKITTSHNHKCQRPKCNICGEKLDSDAGDHLCFIQPLPPTKDHADKLIFYDCETFVVQQNVHKPFLVCTKTLSGVRWMSYGLNCVRDFLLHFRRPAYLNSVFVAHNAKGFDSYLILNTMIEMGMQPSLIMQGSKILCFQDPDFNLKFIDSLSFLTMRLSAMPKALGFSDQTKGHFPHGFSSEKNLQYIGAYPPPHDYGVERMTPAQQQEFYGWYREVSQGTFDFEKEARLYCENDVDILAKGCVLFRNQFLTDTGVDPFSCITIASACMKVFLTKFLPPKTLAIPSPDNYRCQTKSYSHASIQWLEWVARSNNVFIQHALNKGEKQVGPYFVDGFAEIDGVAYAWEFLGCFYHGCPSCFNPHDTCPLRRVPFEELHAASEEKMQALKSVYGVQTVVMWEHEWSALKNVHAGVKAFLRSFLPPEPLCPRDALFGGRTSAVRLRYTAGPNETVHYVDVTSLYPYVNCNFSYPLGHPTIIHKDFDHPQNYFGFIKATIHPPRGLLFPVLPYKTSRGKLVFTLCRSCAEINNQRGPCRHDERARALTGVWVSVEVNKALEVGYRVGKIIEVWHFDRCSDSIFVGYMHTFLKGKQEASGYPPEAADQESREKYIRDYELHQGVRLDADKIEVNPAKRQVAKLCLNSFWGKFAQRSNLPQTTLVSDPEDFLRFMFSGQYNVKYFNFLNDKTAMIQWNYHKRCVVPPGRANNVFIAAFTTAYARLKLYSYLEQVQENVLYMDTDSLIYVVKEGGAPLKLGNYLGDLTDELDGDTIQEFAAAGPKSYAYQTRQKKKVVLRVKGITQTRECCEQVNFDSVRELVEGYLEGSRGGAIETPQHNIRRNKKSFLLKNCTFQKKFRVVYDKRRLFSDGTTLPFGY
nr:TPA_asm: PolB [Larimichthys croaker adintovirus]